MRICESEENRRKLAWLVPGYILLAWFFCVVFQPLGLTSVPGHGNNNDYNDESLYEIINLQDDPQWISRCESGHRQKITLGQGRGSGLILRLTHQEFYRYKEYNCSLEILAGPGMDGVTAVIEHMDLRQEETGHWDKAACPDYVEIRTEVSMVKEQMCGQWDIKRDEPLTIAGSRRNIIGYCYEDRSGHSCETKSILVDVAIEHNQTLSDQFPGLRKEDRHGFTLVFTAWKHADEEGACYEGEMTCPTTDGGVHADKNHCIWQKMLCDGHQNCGFLVNKDEWGCRLGRDTAWSFGTITVLVTIWVAIVTVLMLATVFLLQWNRISFRTPLDMLAESRAGAGHEGGAIPVTTTSDHREAGQVMSTTTAADPRTGGMVSIMVMYRPPAGSGQTGTSKTVDLPPTYDSLFLGENPPGYNMLTVNLPSSGEHPVTEEAAPANAGIHISSPSTDNVPRATQIPTNPSRSNEETNNADEQLLTISSTESQAKHSNSSELLDILGSSPLIAQSSQSPNTTTADDNPDIPITDTAIINLEESRNPSDNLLQSEYSSMNLLEDKLCGGPGPATALDQIPV